MRSCDLQLRLVLEALSPVDAFNQAIIDEKGYYNHLKLTNMTRANNNKNFNTVKKEPSMNIEKSNPCMKCGNFFCQRTLECLLSKGNLIKHL